MFTIADKWILGGTWVKLLITAIIILLLWIAPSSAGQVSDVAAPLDQETGARIETLLQSRSASTLPLIGVSRLFSHEQILDLYNQRDFLPIWIEGLQLKAEAQLLLEALRNAGARRTLRK